MTYRLRTTDRRGNTDFFVVTAQTNAQAQGDARRMHAERHGVGYADVIVNEPVLHPVNMPTRIDLDRDLTRVVL